MDTEKTINVSTTKARFRDFAILQKKAIEQARKTNKPICLRCLKQDYDNGQQQPIKHYLDLEYEILREAEFPESKKNPIPEKLIDYKCPRGHGVTVSMPWHTPSEQTERKPEK